MVRIDLVNMFFLSLLVYKSVAVVHAAAVLP